jgi:hypothetical protein
LNALYDEFSERRKSKKTEESKKTELAKGKKFKVAKMKNKLAKSKDKHREKSKKTKEHKIRKPEDNTKNAQQQNDQCRPARPSGRCFVPLDSVRRVLSTTSLSHGRRMNVFFVG